MPAGHSCNFALCAAACAELAAACAVLALLDLACAGACACAAVAAAPDAAGVAEQCSAFFRFLRALGL